MVRRAYPDATTAATVEDAQNVLWRISAQDYPLCSRTAAAAPGASPAAEAATLWRVAGEDLLPRPTPRIAPGFMLAGKLAYLEANSVPTAHFEHPTPLGLLVIDATSTLFVDWGDNTAPTPAPAGLGRTAPSPIRGAGPADTT